MRTILRWTGVIAILLSSWAAPAPRAQAASLDTTADGVFGQPDFTHNTYNNGGISANSLFDPTDLALDGQGNLYVVDGGNHRVLEFDQQLSPLLRLFLPLLMR